MSVSFASALNEKVHVISERGMPEDMQLREFVKHGRTIAYALKERVRDFQVSKKSLTIPENRGEAREFIRQFEELVNLIAKVEKVAVDFKEEDIKPIDDFVSRVKEQFLTRGHGVIVNTSTNLIDRIDALRESIKGYDEADKK